MIHDIDHDENSPSTHHCCAVVVRQGKTVLWYLSLPIYLSIYLSTQVPHFHPQW